MSDNVRSNSNKDGPGLPTQQGVVPQPLSERESWPLVDIVVVSYNSARYIGDCLRALLGLDYPVFTVTLVDNASTDDTIKIVEQDFPKVQLIRSPRNLGFAAACNLGLRDGKAPHAAIVNPDAMVRFTWLKEAMRPFKGNRGSERVGIVGSKILYPNRATIQHAGGIFGYPLAETWHYGYGEEDHGQFDTPRQADFVTGAAMVMDRRMLKELNYFDSRFYPLFFEDVDICFRAWNAGWAVIYEPRAVVIHHESSTYQRNSQGYYRNYHLNRLRFVLKHYTHRQLFGDFVPAEAARLREELDPNDRQALLELYSSALTMEEQAAARPGQRSDNAAVPGGFNSFDAQSGLQQEDERRQQLKNTLRDVQANWQVEEKPFASNIPGVAWFRSFVVSLGSRWYVKQILAQQVEFNAAVYRQLNELSRQVQELQAVGTMQSAVLGARLGEIDEQVHADLARAVARVSSLDKGLHNLQGQLELLASGAGSPPKRNNRSTGPLNPTLRDWRDLNAALDEANSRPAAASPPPSGLPSHEEIDAALLNILDNEAGPRPPGTNRPDEQTNRR